jgi:AhpD family alkylhydroperoxidase
MPQIPLAPGVPGIRGPMVFRSDTAKPLRQLAETLLRSARTLTPAERELIATYVSALNDCLYCQTVHGYPATYLNGDEALVA